MDGAVVVLILGGLDVTEDEKDDSAEEAREETDRVESPVRRGTIVSKIRVGTTLADEHVPLALNKSSEDDEEHTNPDLETSMTMDNDEPSTNALSDEEGTRQQEGDEAEDELEPVKRQQSDAQPSVHGPELLHTSLLLPVNDVSKTSDGGSDGKEVEETVKNLAEEVASRQHLEAEDGQSTETHEQDHQNRVPVEGAPLLVTDRPVDSSSGQTSVIHRKAALRSDKKR